MHIVYAYIILIKEENIVDTTERTLVAVTHAMSLKNETNNSNKR